MRSAGMARGLDLSRPGSLARLLPPREADYGGFWFFAFPATMCERAGLLMPFFIKADDMEFGLRLRAAAGARIVPLPGIAVWHPSLKNNPFWVNYYYARNFMIANAIHGVDMPARVLWLVLCRVLAYVAVGRSRDARIYLEAFEDYMSGPARLAETDAERRHERLLAECREPRAVGWKGVRDAFETMTRALGAVLRLVWLWKDTRAAWGHAAPGLSNRTYWESRFN